MHGPSTRELCAFDLDDFTTGVMTTVGAYAVGNVFITAIRAQDEMTWTKCVMSAPAITATFRNLSLRKGWHDYYSSKFAQ